MLLRTHHILFLCLLLTSCTWFSSSDKDVFLGSPQRPIQMMLVPGQDAMVLEENGKIIADLLRKKTGLFIEIKVPHSYIAIVEALGGKHVDSAMINTFGYILAKEKYQAHARLTGTFNGTHEYWGQIITRKNHLQSIKDIDGKKFAFVEATSTSGYLMPAKFFKENNIHPSETIFAGKHDSVVRMVYQGQVDAGATFFTPADTNGEPRDARRLIAKEYPDVYEKVVILEKTGPIPNDPVVFRKDFPKELEDKVVQGLKDIVKTPEGQQALKEIYNITDLVDSDEKEYEKISSVLMELGKKAHEFIK
jgi:phosphonate transport system substrate-binding protein